MTKPLEQRIIDAMDRLFGDGRAMSEEDVAIFDTGGWDERAWGRVFESIHEEHLRTRFGLVRVLMSDASEQDKQEAKSEYLEYALAVREEMRNALRKWQPVLHRIMRPH